MNRVLTGPTRDRETVPHDKLVDRDRPVLPQPDDRPGQEPDDERIVAGIEQRGLVKESLAQHLEHAERARELRHGADEPVPGPDPPGMRLLIELERRSLTRRPGPPSESDQEQYDPGRASLPYSGRARPPALFRALPAQASSRCVRSRSWITPRSRTMPGSRVLDRSRHLKSCVTHSGREYPGCRLSSSNQVDVDRLRGIPFLLDLLSEFGDTILNPRTCVGVPGTPY
jgi:hypothetical protein